MKTRNYSIRFFPTLLVSAMLATECVCADVNETDSPPVSAATEKIVKVELGHLRRGTKMVKELKIFNPFESV